MTGLQWIEALAARLGLALLRRLGPVLASTVAGRIAAVIGPHLAVSRVADANLRAALPALDAARRRRVVRGVWENLGRTVGEFPHVAGLRETAAGPGWEITGSQHLAAVQAGGGPVIFFSGHIGNWEILPVALAGRGIALSSLYRAADNPAVDALIQGIRRQALGPEAAMFPKGAAGARAALAHLARGGALGLLVDQKMNDGIAVEFFGRRAMTAPALAALAQRFDCPVVPGHVQRIGPARFRLVVDPPLPVVRTGDRAADILALTRQVNACLEQWILERPEAWLWLHRRWGKMSVP